MWFLAFPSFVVQGQLAKQTKARLLTERQLSSRQGMCRMLASIMLFQYYEKTNPTPQFVHLQIIFKFQGETNKGLYIQGPRDG